MVFYKGAVTFDNLKHMPLDEIFQLNFYAHKYKQQIERESKRNGI